MSGLIWKSQIALSVPPTLPSHIARKSDLDNELSNYYDKTNTDNLISTLNATITSLQTTITDLQSTIITLQDKVTELENTTIKNNTPIVISE